MKAFYVALLMAIGGNVFYHLAQKSVAKDVSPLHALIVAYAVALVLCCGAAFFQKGDKALLQSLTEVNWAVWGVGASAFLIELGVLLAYRSGGQIGLLGISVAVATNLILLPVGILLFRENLTKWNLLGVVLCVAGLILVVKK